MGQVKLSMAASLRKLERCNYDRLLSVAIHDIPDAPFAMDAEVRKLKYLLESLV